MMLYSLLPITAKAFIPAGHSKQALNSGESNMRDFPHVCQSVLLFGSRYFQIIVNLQVQPILRCLPQSADQPQSQFRCDRPSPFENMRYAHRRHADCVGKGGLGQIQAFEYFMQKFARRTGGKPSVIMLLSPVHLLSLAGFLTRPVKNTAAKPVIAKPAIVPPASGCPCTAV